MMCFPKQVAHPLNSVANSISCCLLSNYRQPLPRKRCYKASFTSITKMHQKVRTLLRLHIWRPSLNMLRFQTFDVKYRTWRGMIDKRSDRELLRIAREDTQAFSVIYQRYYQHLCSYADAIPHDKDYSQDVASETLVRLVEHASWILTTNHQVAPWLFFICRNIALNEAKRRRFLSTNVDVEILACSDTKNNQVREADKYASNIRNAVGKLPPFEYACIVLRHVEKKKTAEISSQLGCSPRQVTVALNYAYKLLRKELSGLKEK